MKIFRFGLLIVFLLMLVMPTYCQENPVVPKRTPEQEAAKQTEKLQQELNLNQEQVKQVYEINLRYARERQISNKRSEAMERMKNKNAAIEQVLNPEQNTRLQSKRYERTYFETNIQNRNQTTNPSNLRSSTNFRSGQSVRVPANQEINNRNTNRPVNPDFRPGMQQGQSVRRSTTTAPPPYQYQNNSSSRSSSAPGYTPRRPETTMPSPNNSTGNQRQTTPATSSGRSNPENSNRK